MWWFVGIPFFVAIVVAVPLCIKGFRRDGGNATVALIGAAMLAIAGPCLLIWAWVYLMDNLK